MEYGHDARVLEVVDSHRVRVVNETALTKWHSWTLGYMEEIQNLAGQHCISHIITFIVRNTIVSDA